MAGIRRAHGGTAVWASENIFNNHDVRTLQPQGQQALPIRGPA